MSKTTYGLNEDERSLVALALTNSGERWREIGRAVDIPPQVRDILYAQAKQAERLAIRFSGADAVSIEGTF